MGKEVEIKVALDEDRRQQVIERLKERGTDHGEQHQTDTYYTAPHRDFMETRECLRIRESDDTLELTYKGPTTEAMRDAGQFWKAELDIDLKDREQATVLLDALGCEQLVDVVKHRRAFSVGDQHVTLDHVEDAGHFLEIETEAADGDEADARSRNRELLAELGVQDPDVVDQPYRDLVMEARGLWTSSS